MKDFMSKVAVITGAGSGMGRYLAVLLAKSGCDVVICDVNEDTLAGTAAMLKNYNVAVSSHRLDVGDEAAINALPEKVIAQHGKVDLVFNNAGITIDSDFANMPEPGKAAEAALISAFLQSPSLAVQASNMNKSRTEFSSSLEYMFVASASADVTNSDALKNHLRFFSGQQNLEPFVVTLATAGGTERGCRRQITRNGERPTCENLARASRAAELLQLEV